MMWAESNEWCPIEQEMPPVGESVLIWTKHAIHIASYWESHWAIELSRDKRLEIYPAERAVSITHWRLLPPPPMSDELKSDIAELLA